MEASRELPTTLRQLTADPVCRQAADGLVDAAFVRSIGTQVALVSRLLQGGGVVG